MGIDAIIKGVGDIISGTVGKAIKDKDQSEQLKAELTLAVFENLRHNMTAQKDVLLAELGGESPLQRNWRPILMLVIVAIVANNYILYPYLSLFVDSVVVLELPEKLWSLMQIGVGGYIVGRSGEKMVKTYTAGNSKG